MVMSVLSFVLLSIVCINGDRQNSARQYAQKPRGQMGFKWTKQYARQGFSSSNYGNSANKEQQQSPYPYGKGTPGAFGNAPPSNTEEPAISSTENTESTTSSESSEEPVMEPTSNTEEDSDDIDNTNTNTDEPIEISTSNIETVELVENQNENQEQQEEIDQHQPPIMNCLYDKCDESFSACFNDQQCKDWMSEWQENKSLRPECLPSYPSQDETNLPSSTFAPKTEEFQATADVNFESTENTESTTSNTEEGTSSTSGSTENTYDEDAETSYSSTDIIGDEEEPFEATTSECEYNELFWNAYNCGVDNYCYPDQLKLAQSHSYLLSPSDYRTHSNTTGSKSSTNDWTLLMVALTSGIAAIIIFEVARRLYTAFQVKIECECQCVAVNNSLRYLKNKWEQIRGYKYEKTHGDLDAIEESDDAAMYGRGSDKEESMITKDRDTMGVTYNGPLNDDSDNSDDEELQKTSSSKAMSLDEQTDDDNIIDDQFVHNKSTNEEQKDEEEQQEEIAKEPVQEL